MTKKGSKISVKPVIAQRTTKCYFCKDDIVPGSERLTDAGQLKLKKTTGEDYVHYYRRHFHFRNKDKQSCYDLYAEERFASLPHVVVGNNKSGRPKLPLSVEEMKLRTRLLKRLSSQIDYYIIKGHLDLHNEMSLGEITVKKARQAERFSRNLAKIIEGLKDVGGVPSKYRGYDKETQE